MAKFTFVGDPKDGFSGPESIRVGGVDFPKGEAVTVDDDLAAKLKGHSHFAEGTAKPPKQPDDDKPARPPPKSRG